MSLVGGEVTTALKDMQAEIAELRQTVDRLIDVMERKYSEMVAAYDRQAARLLPPPRRGWRAWLRS